MKTSKDNKDRFIEFLKWLKDEVNKEIRTPKERIIYGDMKYCEEWKEAIELYNKDINNQ